LSVNNGQPGNQTTFNSAFLSRTTNSNTIGKIDLENVSTTSLVDLQRIINELLDQQGLDNQAATDANAKVYSSNNVVSNGDDQKVSIGKLDGEFDVSTGHSHDGIGSSQIEATNLLNINQIQNSLLVFVDDAAFETDKGSVAAQGDVYFNSTDLKVRVHDGVAFDELSGAVAMEREIPTGLINGVNTSYTLSFVPLSAEHISVYIDGTFQEDADFSLLGNTITMGTAPALGQSVFVWYMHDGNVSPISPPAGTEALEYHLVTAGEEAAKQFTLSATPATAAKTLVDIIGGTSQQFGVDFTITGDVFDWSGFSLDGLLTDGDVVRLRIVS